MRSLGIYIRWLCSLAYVSLTIYTFVLGIGQIARKEGDMAGVFLCDEQNSGNGSLTQCYGLNDAMTCGAAECVRSSCGRELFPVTGISYAGSSDPFSPDAATSTDSFITIMALLYSLMCPFIIGKYFVSIFMISGNVIPLTRLGMIQFALFTNDILFKNIAKQPRPSGSCLYFISHGMPSGHAVTSIGLLTFILLELLVYHPSLFGKESTTMSVDFDVKETRTFAWGFGWQEKSHQAENNLSDEVKSSIVEDGDGRAPLASSLNSASIESVDTDDGQVPLLSSLYSMSTVEVSNTSSLIGDSQQPRTHQKSKWILHYYAILWTILLLPIPLSRVYLHDHTVMQVLVGSFLGVILGGIYHFIIIRGWLCLFVVNSKIVMEYVVNCRFGKWIGLNFGVGGENMQMFSLSTDSSIS